MASDHRPILAAQPTASLTYVLGMLAGRPLRETDAGRIAAICTELRARGEWTAFYEGLSDALQDQLAMLEMADRGQHFAVHGQRRLV